MCGQINVPKIIYTGNIFRGNFFGFFNFHPPRSFTGESNFVPTPAQKTEFGGIDVAGFDSLPPGKSPQIIIVEFPRGNSAPQGCFGVNESWGKINIWWNLSHFGGINIWKFLTWIPPKGLGGIKMINGRQTRFNSPVQTKGGNFSGGNQIFSFPRKWLGDGNDFLFPLKMFPV